MTASQSDPPPDDHGRMTPAYVRVLAIEVLVLAILYWAGRHFA